MRRNSSAGMASLSVIDEGFQRGGAETQRKGEEWREDALNECGTGPLGVSGRKRRQECRRCRLESRLHVAARPGGRSHLVRLRRDVQTPVAGENACHTAERGEKHLPAEIILFSILLGYQDFPYTLWRRAQLYLVGRMKALALVEMAAAVESSDNGARTIAAFESLMRQHERLVLVTALRLLGKLEDAQDASQEVFLRLYRNLGKIEAVENVPGWLYRVTVNVCHDMTRRRPASVAVDEMPELAATGGRQRV